MNGFNVCEAGQWVQMIPAVDGNAGAPVTAYGFSMANWEHASIVIGFGVTAGTPTSILVYASTAATSGTRTALAFRYYPQTTANGGVLGAGVDVAATGITTITTNNNTFYGIEIDSAQLPDGKPYIQIDVTIPASSNLLAAFAALSGGRYQFVGSPAATA